MKSAFLALTVAVGLETVPALACTVPSTVALAKTSDVIVAGTASFDNHARTGIIAARRVTKGTAARSYRVVWDPLDLESLGVACPPWFPISHRERATYYLKDRGDGTFSVLGTAKAKSLD